MRKKLPRLRGDPTGMNGTAAEATLSQQEPRDNGWTRVVDLPGAEMFKFLNTHVVKKIGKAPEGHERSITFISVPERGVIQLTVTDFVPHQATDQQVQ